MGTTWTEERRKKFRATIEAKKNATELTPEQKLERKREKDRAYRRRIKANAGGIKSDSSDPSGIRVFCMRCGYLMEIRTREDLKF